ncbi:MAG: hypothetical protein ACI9U2_004100 [Bradymonadia bacterium]|jgi:hypothetical protein
MVDPASQVPSQVGRYEVRGVVGGGGMGEVYRVFDPINRREVALKVLKFSYPRALHYFKREFRAVARLTHPNLVELHDLHHDGERYFYTMELVDGVDFYVYVNGHNRLVTDRTVLTVPARLERVQNGIVGLLRALAYLHENGCIHRDIKPSNVLVDREGEVRLVDFGIVKQLLPGGVGQSLSQVFGTSTYFSPEQSLGSSVTSATDLYAVGVVLYELLVGTPPFDGDSAEVAIAHRTKAPPDLYERSDLPTDLVRVCMELLSKAPEDRPSAREALEMLDAPLAHDVSETEFVGRREARKVLHRALDRVRAGRGRIILLEGPSGAGKTALVEAFAQEARLFGASAFMGTCVHRDHVAFRGLDTAVERIAEAYRKQSARILRKMPEAERASLLRGFTFLAELLPVHLHGEPEPDVSAGLGLQSLLRSLSEKRLMILVVEQMHLADAATLDAIEIMQRGGGLPPVLFVFTHRPEAVSPTGRHAAFFDLLKAHPGTERVELPPFALEETRLFVRNHLGSTAEWITEHVHSETRGVPLFVQALVHHIRQNSGATPPSFESMVLSQMADLPEPAQRVLAAVCLARGTSVPGRVLRKACSLDANALYESLTALNRAGLLRTEASSDGEINAVTVHPRLMSVARESLDAELTRQMHGLLAKAYQMSSGRASEIQHHWAGAGEPDQAGRFAGRAANEAENGGDYERAAELYALALKDTDAEAARAELYLQQSECYALAGRTIEAAKALSRLAEEYPKRGAPWKARRIQLQLIGGEVGDVANEAADLSAPARITIADLLVPYDALAAERLIDGLDTTDARLVRARILCTRHDATALAEARHLVDTAVHGASVRDRVTHAHAKAVVCRAEGAHRAAAAVLEEAFDIGAKLSTREPLSLRLTMGRALLALERGNISKARTAGRSLLMAARDRGLIGLRGRACTLQAHIHLEAGERNAAGQLLVEARSCWPGERITAPHVYVALTRIRQLLYGKRLVEAEANLRTLKGDGRYRVFLVQREFARSFALLYTRLCAVAGLKRFMDDRGDTHTAVERIARARMALGRTLPRPEHWLHTLEAIEALLRYRAGEAETLLANRLTQPELRAEDPRILSIQYAVLYAALAHQGRQDDTLEDQAREAVREAGAAVPVEAQLLLPLPGNRSL